MANEWVRRFYGMDIPQAVVEAADENLTDRSIDDLVDAHLAINYSYFGAIDKTLAGFVILDDEGDNYTLLDLRDGQQVWWQDHETREVSLKFDKLADLVAVRAEIARAGDEADTDAIESAYAAATPKGARKVPTPALLDRYQWLVWFLARPLTQGGKPTQTLDDLVRGGIGRFRHTWPRREQLAAAFEDELPSLASDPHLAINSHLHPTAIADDEARARVVAAIGDRGPDLLRAFVSRLGRLPLAGDLPIVPGFRARRVIGLGYGAFAYEADELPRAMLRALEIDPQTQSLQTALHVVGGLEDGTLATDEVSAMIARTGTTSPGTALVAAVLDQRAGKTSSLYAEELAHHLATSHAERSEAQGAGGPTGSAGVAGGSAPRAIDPWWLALEALWKVHGLTTAGATLIAATRPIVAADRFHKRGLAMALRAAKLAGEPTAPLEADLALAERVLEPFTRIAQQPKDWRAVVDELFPDAQRAIAWRILQRAELNKPDPAAAAWAAGVVIAGEEPERGALVGRALAGLDAGTQALVVDQAKDAIDRADHPLIDVLLAMLDAPEPEGSDYGAIIAAERSKETALKALAPWFHHPHVFERVMELVERPAGRSLQDPLWNKLFSPFTKETYVVPRLTAEQAVRVARAMIEVILRHPQIHARNAAGHQLYRFSHQGAEDFLIAALTQYGDRYASATGPGASLDHGKTETEQLGDIVANLYAAVRGLGTPRARTALIERLFTERRSYWRMGSAIKDMWSDAVQAEILAALAARKDARAASLYAYALADHVKQGPALVALGRLLAGFEPGTDPLERGFFHYALAVCEKAALDARDYELVRALHTAAAWIEEKAIEPDNYTRGRDWDNPLDAPEVVKELARVLSGEADQARQALVAAAEASRTTGKPNLKISDAQLGELAGGQVASRVLHDPTTGELWFVDTEGRLQYFDGFVVGNAPFSAHAIALGGMREHLTGTTSIDDRAMWWDKRAGSYREALRLGDRVILCWGPNNGVSARYVLVFRDAARATAAMAQLRAYPAKGYAEGDCFYVPGKGAIIRTYYVPLPDGGYNSERERCYVLNGALAGGESVGEAQAIAAHQATELGWLRDGNGTLLTVEWSERLRCDADLTVKEWLKARFRDDGKDPVWHLRALPALATYLREHALEVPGLAIEIDGPAAEADIDALAAARTHGVPDSLRALWRAHAGARWTLDGAGRRLLSPREVLAHRDAARALGAAYLAKLTPAAAETARPLFEHLDVIVVDQAGAPVTILADIARDDGRVFSHAYPDPTDMWWEKSLSWMLATRLLGDLEDLLAERAPVLARLMHGQRINPDERRAYLEKPGAFWELIVDPMTGVISTRFGKLGQAGSTSVERLEPAEALKVFDKKVAEKKKGGYRERPAAKANKPAAKAKKPAAKKPAAKKPAAKKAAGRGTGRGTGTGSRR